jgi:hypothetical protein
MKYPVFLKRNDTIGVVATSLGATRSPYLPRYLNFKNKFKDLGYNIIESNKTVIRLDNGKEICAYEFMLERIDGIYFYYIDANNLQIAKIMKLVNIKNVEKLI